jgi:hypothetical protein
MDSLRSINFIAISPRLPDVMMVGYTDGKIWKSTNAGAHWERISEGLPSRNCTHILFDPFDDSTYYASFSGYISESVMKTTNGGASWFSISGNLPAIPTNALAINPRNPDEIYVGTDFAVYATTDGGENWQVLGEGMPKVVVVDLDLHPVSGQLIAATHGRSIYGLTVTTSVELLSFSASRAGAGVDLVWRTGSTAALRGFAVERALDDDDWMEIGYIPAEASIAVRGYTYSDAVIPAAAVKARYRLKQSRMDGSIEYSHELQVDFTTYPSDFALERNFPNPFNPGTSIRYSLPRSGHIRLHVTDVRGALLHVIFEGPQYAGTHVHHFNAPDLPSGAYFYHLEYDNRRLTRSMMLMK